MRAAVDIAHSGATARQTCGGSVHRGNGRKGRQRRHDSSCAAAQGAGRARGRGGGGGGGGIAVGRARTERPEVGFEGVVLLEHLGRHVVMAKPTSSLKRSRGLMKMDRPKSVALISALHARRGRCCGSGARPAALLTLQLRRGNGVLAALAPYQLLPHSARRDDWAVHGGTELNTPSGSNTRR